LFSFNKQDRRRKGKAIIVVVEVWPRLRPARKISGRPCVSSRQPD